MTEEIQALAARSADLEKAMAANVEAQVATASTRQQTLYAQNEATMAYLDAVRLALAAIQAKIEANAALLTRN